MNLSTTYLGLKLRSPLVPSASPLSEDVGKIKNLEDAGAGAVVFHSLFEEQIRQERLDQQHHHTEHADIFAEATSFFPEASTFHVGVDLYLEHIAEAKKACDIPMIASLNGSSPGGWTDFASDMQEAGADALELNVYSIPTDLGLSSEKVEAETIEIVKAVKGRVSIPVAVKLSPYYSNFANMAKRLVEVGADGLVLFNRFYQPDVDIEALEVRSTVALSHSNELRLPLQWIAILRGRLSASLAATSGIHEAEDALKALMVGADVAMLCSTLLKKGIGHLSKIGQDMTVWLEEHEYESVEQLKGSMSQLHSPDPAAFERAQYMRVLQGYPRH